MRFLATQSTGRTGYAALPQTWLDLPCLPFAAKRAIVWVELPEASAQNSLRKALFNLRQLLGPFLEISRDRADGKLLASASFDL